VSIAVPKKITYSVREAWRTHAEPIQPPALTKIHCRSEAGKMCPGYFALRSLCTFWNAFFTSNGAVVSAFQNTTIKITRVFQYYTELMYQHHININNKLSVIQPPDHDNKLAKYRDLKILVTGHSRSLQISPFDRLPMRRFIVTMALTNAPTALGGELKSIVSIYQSINQQSDGCRHLIASVSVS